MKPKGLIVYFVNRDAFSGFDEERILKLMTETNKEMVEASKVKGYSIIFVPTVNEATRIEKIDFDKPFPKLKEEKL